MTRSPGHHDADGRLTARRPPDDMLPYVNPVDAALARRPPRGGLRLLLAVAFMFVALLGWAAFAELDEVVHAAGQVVPSQRTQSIQNLEGGILRAVLVHEGQVVEKDAPLAQIDNQLAESSYRDAAQRVFENRVALVRLEAELGGTSPVYSDEMRQQSPQTVADHLAAYEARQQQRKAEIDVLAAQYRQRAQEVEEQLARKKQLEQSLVLATEQRDLTKPLMERKAYPRLEYLGLEQKVVQLQGDVESLAASIPKTRAAMQEAQERMTARQAEQRATTSEEINKRRSELRSLEETLAAGSDRVTRTELRSPVRGTVKQVLMHTTGGVVKPGESIMEIVPLTDNLLIEAKVRPADVAFLHPGQHAMVKFTAYDFSIYGGLPATVEHMSADTIEDRRGDTYYLVHLQTGRDAITYRNEKLPVIPGMVTTVDIMTGKKTVLDYLLKPLLKARQNALRER